MSDPACAGLLWLVGQVSTTASAKVDELLAADADDESLRRSAASRQLSRLGLGRVGVPDEPAAVVVSSSSGTRRACWEPRPRETWETPATHASSS